MHDVDPAIVTQQNAAVVLKALALIVAEVARLQADSLELVIQDTRFGQGRYPGGLRSIGQSVSSHP